MDLQPQNEYIVSYLLETKRSRFLFAILFCCYTSFSLVHQVIVDFPSLNWWFSCGKIYKQRCVWFYCTSESFMRNDSMRKPFPSKYRIPRYIYFHAEMFFSISRINLPLANAQKPTIFTPNRENDVFAFISIFRSKKDIMLM